MEKFCIFFISLLYLSIPSLSTLSPPLPSTLSSSSSSSSSSTLTCSSSMISLMQSLSCSNGKIGLSSSCQCQTQSSSTTTSTTSSSCHFAYMREYLPNHSLLKLSSWNETIRLCNHQFSMLLTNNIHKKSSFINSHGYPLDISQEVCQQKEELSITSKRRYHPCSVSIGKFLRYNSLFEYRLFGRGTRIHGKTSNNHHSKDTLVDIFYNFPWRWAQGIPECIERNLTSWNCAFSDLSTYYDATRTSHEANSHHHHRHQYIVRNSCDPPDEIDNLSSISNTLSSATQMKSRKQQWKKRKQHSRELKETCENSETTYSSIEIPAFQNMINLLRDYRVNQPDHMSQLLLYGHLLVMLSRPSTPVWEYLEKNLIYLPSSEQQQPDSPSPDSPPSASASASASESRDNLLKGMKNVYHGQYHSFSTNSQTTKQVISVSMHVRQGDSCDYQVRYELPAESRYLSSKTGQRPCYHVDVYMNKLYYLQGKYGVNRVYLATDSHEMISRIQNEKQFEWIYIQTPRDIFHSSVDATLATSTASSSSSSTAATTEAATSERTKKWVDFYPHSYNSIVTYSAVCDLFLMRFGDIFLGAFTSHFSKLAYYLMIGTKLSILPFISLDYPLSCDTVDDCTLDDITRRNQTIEMIINRAPECLKQDEGGWMRGARDPCGIYL